jgi:acyl-CoA synthetase (NDP forming)
MTIDLQPLLAPRSVAVLGASERAPIGRAIVESLDRLGFAGAVYPINPRYETLLGRPCYPSLRALPAAPDVVAFCVNYTRIIDEFRLLPECGARAAVIFDGGFGERGGDGARLQAEIVDICAGAGIALAGPNCMGIINPSAGSSTYLQRVRDTDGLRGNVGLITQSGSICIGMLSDLRRFGYSLVVSSGNEAVVNTSAYLEYLIDDPHTEIIATFTETVREPERYVAALDRAADKGKPVVVLKVGQSLRAQRAITSHTGGLAGESRVFSEVLRAHRAIEVADLDELTEVLAVWQGKVKPRGERIGVVTASGGQAELILDVASAAGIDLPPLGDAERAEVERVVGVVGGDGNPLDAWGSGDFRTNLPHALGVLGASPDYDAVVFCTDHFDGQGMGEEDRPLLYASCITEAAAQSDKPHFLMNMRPGLMHRGQLAMLTQAGIAMIGGTRQGLGAVRRLARQAQHLPAARPMAAPGGLRLVDMLGASGQRQRLHEADAKRLLAAYGLPVTRERLAASLAEAIDAARAIGFPVVLKAVSDDIPHKSELGLVEIGIADESALRASWAALAERLSRLPLSTGAAGMLVQEMVSDGVEVFAGVARDPDFGLTLAFGSGGVGIEVTDDIALRLLPLRQGDAEAMIAETRAALLLEAWRGRPRADVESLVACLYALAHFAMSEADHIAEIDLNPIKVRAEGSGCMIVDALIVTTTAP